MGGSRKKVSSSADKYELVILPKISDIKQWVMSGATIREICGNLQISPDTWYRACKDHETLGELVNMAKELINSDVEKSLLKLCTGYDYEEIRTVVEEDKNGKKRTRIEKVKKHQPPSSNAISFWLRNRVPDQWNDRREIILDTKQNEEERKRMFLNMITEDNPIEAEYEVQESVDAGFEEEDIEDTEAE